MSPAWLALLVGFAVGLIATAITPCCAIVAKGAVSSLESAL